ncbi:hypothetical protein KR51_00023640 [Rubidibacter lacunae KORDI 51-2]|uniref:Glycosyl hydrolase-like 10 domain-containing protein n=1 Tax=Rubidibacter lacunae KORDI 51-2 TaxID=582515 RepID=U5DJN5_9CHRO|nr:family 10 glycosylhydrolase [Rubidibacter lacunae]ERN41102.1 hypothetical protein KR51_00023640 [Rubidibacter lacunae KORDI 51-2]
MFGRIQRPHWLQFRKPHRFLALCFAAIATVYTLSFIYTTRSASAAYPAAELRGVWLTNVDSEILFSSKGTRDALDRLARLNFNTIYPTVWQNGYTLFPSQVTQSEYGVTVDPATSEGGRDMLAELVDGGHARGMTVIPWFEFGFMAPEDSELVRQHPDWLTNHYDGSFVQLKGDGTFRAVWLNPFNPEVQQFILDMVLETVKTYDVDGIQFDDHFSLPIDFGYDRLSIRRFEDSLHGVKLSDAQRAHQWTRWRANELTAFMQRLHDEVKAIHPDCIISLSPNPFLFALTSHLQNWFTWQELGLVDEVVLQVYRDDLQRFVSELDRPEIRLARARVPISIGILSGLKNRSTPINVVRAQVQAVRDRGFSGVSFFFYESLWRWARRESYFDRERALYQLFARPLSRPVIPTS